MKYSYYFCIETTNDISTTRTGVHNRRLSSLYNLNNMTWKKANIIIDGQKMEVPAPDIISASRSTDIPAFYADWFFHRLETGYSVWNNPFNGKKSYISYRNTRFIVFWSDRKSTRLNSSHVSISYAVFCLKTKINRS